MVIAATTPQEGVSTVHQIVGADGVTIQQFNEAAGGQVVFHTHVHVLAGSSGMTEALV